MAEVNKYRLQDEDGIVQFVTLEDAIETVKMDPAKFAMIVENSTGKVVTVWMRDALGVGDVWTWHTPPEYKALVDYTLEMIEAKIKDETGIPQIYQDEVKKLIEGRGAEKIYEQLVEKVWDYIADNCSFPLNPNDHEEDEEDAAMALQDYAFGLFKKTYLSEVSS